MEIPETDQEGYDYDWFAIDSNGNIGHFASNTGILPHSVAKSAEDLKVLTDYFRSLKAEESNYLLANGFIFPRDIKTEEQRENFLSTYVDYSTRGLYSFDRNQPEKNWGFKPFLYGLITIPIKPLSMEYLPIHIREIIIRTVYNGNFSPNSNITNTLDIQDVS
ncbi:MAG: hypothetical protein EOO60_10715 [Hymenobacter sp.]|nr:MAG: hypothetical protein EOO60_10715 [Hymenobacter sp.]